MKESRAGQPAGPVKKEEVRELSTQFSRLIKDLENLARQFEEEEIDDVHCLGWTKGERGAALLCQFVDNMETAFLRVRQERRRM